MMKFFKILIAFGWLSINAQSNFKTVKIGNQEWMAENLHSDHYLNGDPIPKVEQRIPWQDFDKGAFCIFNNLVSYGDQFGYLYNLQAIKDPRGLVPKGWHIPTVADWEELITFCGGRDSAAYKLKSTSGWQFLHTGNPAKYNGTNSSGFNALPSGARLPDYQTDFIGDGSFAAWWSSTDGKVMFRSSTDSTAGTFFYETKNVPFEFKKNLAQVKNHFALSIRCIKDRDPNIQPTVRKAKIGLILLDLDKPLADELQIYVTGGAYIKDVVKGGAGDEAEIQVGDIITDLNGVKINTVADFQEKLSKHVPGEYVKVKIKRPNSAMMQATFDVKLK